jgi:phosphatidylinositol alpha-1,6-mannosyltransferase
MKHLLVTNDFPPKVGGIQNYLWELWRRLPAGRAAVLTTSHPGAAVFDAEQEFPVTRAGRVLLPTPAMLRRIKAEAAAAGAELVVLDPAVPIGLVGPRLGLPYAIVVHGGEMALLAHVPFVRARLARVLRGAEVVIAAGNYVASEVAALAPGVRIVVIPPGVDTTRFSVPSASERSALRTRWGLHDEDEVVLHLSRLVPRKGADVLIVAGSGRDQDRLRRLATRLQAPVRFLGRVDEADKPGLYAACDVFSHVCRSRWFGLEQEGFGIIFLEAAACGAPTIAGASGGAADAVVDGATGFVIDPPKSVAAVAAAVATLVGSPASARAWGAAGRARSVAEFDYDGLAQRLDEALR